MDIVFRRLLRSIVGPPGDVDWTLPWQEIFPHWNERVNFLTARDGFFFFFLAPFCRDWVSVSCLTGQLPGIGTVFILASLQMCKVQRQKVHWQVRGGWGGRRLEAAGSGGSCARRSLKVGGSPSRLWWMVKTWSAVCLGQYWKLANYVSKLPGERWVVKALNWFPENARRVGRPACTSDSMIQQFWRHNQLGNWRHRAQYRFYWTNQLDECISFTESWWTRNVVSACGPFKAAFLGMQVSLFTLRHLYKLKMYWLMDKYKCFHIHYLCVQWNTKIVISVGWRARLTVMSIRLSLSPVRVRGYGLVKDTELLYRGFF